MKRVIVVGGGVAGLVCARRLAAAGLSVQVLEALPQAGGRVASRVYRGAIIDAGLQFIGPEPPYTNAFALIRELGLLDRLRETSPVAALVKRGRVYPYHYGSVTDFLKLPALSLSAKLKLVSAYPNMRRHAAVLDFHHLEKAASLDNEDVTDYVTRLAGREALEHLIQPLMGVFYYYPPVGVSRAFAMIVVNSVGDLGAFCFIGGNGVLAERLCSGLDVTTDARVTLVERIADGVRVEWTQSQQSQSAVADAVVVATPADLATEICEALTDDEYDFLESVSYTSCVVIASCTKRRFGGNTYGVAIAPSESRLLFGVTFEQNKSPDRVPEGQGLALSFLNASQSRALLNADDTTIVASVLEEMNRLWRGYSNAVEWTLPHRFSRATPLFEVGSLKRLAKFLDRPNPTPGIHLCGDYLVGPHLEGAVTSGIRTAAAVTRELVRH